jgi:hypothetical protein
MVASNRFIAIISIFDSTICTTYSTLKFGS